jgi:hypothetical protein
MPILHQRGIALTRRPAHHHRYPHIRLAHNLDIGRIRCI